MDRMMRLVIHTARPVEAALFYDCAGHLLQNAAAHLYESGVVLLRHFLFPYVDLLQLTRAENAVYFGDFLQFVAPESLAPGQMESLIPWDQCRRSLQEHQPQVEPADFLIRWEYADPSFFWPSHHPHMILPGDSPDGHLLVRMKLSLPSLPFRRDSQYRAYAGDFLSLHQIFRRLVTQSGGRLLAFTPYQVAYCAAPRDSARLQDYLEPELCRLALFPCSDSPKN